MCLLSGLCKTKTALYFTLVANLTKIYYLQLLIYTIFNTDLYILYYNKSEPTLRISKPWQLSIDTEKYEVLCSSINHKNCLLLIYRCVTTAAY